MSEGKRKPSGPPYQRCTQGKAVCEVHGQGAFYCARFFHNELELHLEQIKDVEHQRDGLLEKVELQEHDLDRAQEAAKERDAKARELWEELKKSKAKGAVFVLQVSEQLRPDDLYVALRCSLMEEQNIECRPLHSPGTVDLLARWLIFESSDKTRGLIAQIRRPSGQCSCCGCAPMEKHKENCTEKPNDRCAPVPDSYEANASCIKCGEPVSKH